MKMKRLLMLALTLCLCIGLMTVTAFASDTADADETAAYTIVNDGIAAASVTEYLTTAEEVGLALREGMIAHEASISVGYQIPVSSFDGSDAAFNEIMDSFLDVAFAHTGVPNEGDYLYCVYGGLSMPTSYYSDGSYYYMDITFKVNYDTTAAQEAEMDAAVDALLDQLITDGMSDYEKLTAVYDWMTDNITYDYTHLNDSSYKLKQTAYAALINRTAVCQGYATLLYRLALEMDIDCRYISGIGNGGAHGWNIVQLGSKYYNADATWDINYADTNDYQYYLRCDANFDDHTRDAEFETAAFRSAYPMSTTDFDSNDLCAGGHSFGSWSVTKAATCTAEGSQKRTCSRCSASETKAIAAKGHSYTSKVTAATCTAQGYTTFTCSACGSSYKDTYTSAKGHSYGSWSITKAATCTAEGSQKRTCSRCSASETKAIAAKGHSYTSKVTAATCTAQGYTTFTCSACGSSYKDTYTSAKGHSYGSWSVTKAATCTAEGSQKRTCSRCAASETKAIAATGHNYVSGSCTVCGASDGSVRLEAPVAKGANVASSGKIKITWNAVEGAVKYEVYRATSKNGTYSLKRTTTGTGYTNTGTTAGRYYYYYVRAIAADGTYADSNLVGRTCDLARPVVSISNVASTGKNQLSWDAVSGAVKYEIYRASSSSGTYTSIGTTDGTTYVDTASEAGVSYYYRVKAIASKTAANSALSTAKARMADLPRTTVTLSNRASDGKITIKWNAVEGAVKYEVYRATSKNGTYTRISRTTSTSITNTSAAAGKTYYYKVRVIAENSSANSAYSVIKSRTCDLERPDVSITRSSGKPRLSWDKIDGAVSYKIYLATSKNGTYSLVKTTTSRSWKDTNAKSGRTYYYKVVAVCENTAGNSAASLIRYIKSK